MVQTVLVVQSSVAGIVCLGGRMAGEVDEAHPLSLPVSPFGALLIELRPFAAGYLPLALRLPLSNGVPLIAAPDPRLCAALWPGGVIELELIPELVSPAEPPRFLMQQNDARLFFCPSPAPCLRCESSASVSMLPLPAGALIPVPQPLPSGLLLTGSRTEGDQYAVVLSADASSVLLSVTGKNISLLTDSALRLLHPLGDSMGHAALETWAPTQQGWQLVSSEPMWEKGAPVRPETPEAVAICAVEAAQLGLSAEAAAFFAPMLPCSEILRRVSGYDGCVPLRHPLPGGETAVGLMQLRDNVLHILPAVYTAVPGGPHGWQLTQLEVRGES